MYLVEGVEVVCVNKGVSDALFRGQMCLILSYNFNTFFSTLWSIQ